MHHDWQQHNWWSAGASKSDERASSTENCQHHWQQKGPLNMCYKIKYISRFTWSLVVLVHQLCNLHGFRARRGTCVQNIMMRLNVQKQRWHHWNSFLTTECTIRHFGNQKLMQFIEFRRRPNCCSSIVGLIGIRYERNRLRAMNILVLNLAQRLEEIGFQEFHKLITFRQATLDTKTWWQIDAHDVRKSLKLILGHNFLASAVFKKGLVFSYKCIKLIITTNSFLKLRYKKLFSKYKPDRRRYDYCASFPACPCHRFGYRYRLVRPSSKQLWAQ